MLHCTVFMYFMLIKGLQNLVDYKCFKFQDKSLSDGIFFLELLSFVQHRAVNWGLVTKGVIGMFSFYFFNVCLGLNPSFQILFMCESHDLQTEHIPSRIYSIYALYFGFREQRLVIL
jgi:hypothetical protein